MTTFQYGNSTNDYVEVPDDANPGQVKRPEAGYVVAVKASPTLDDLPSVSTQAFGYLTFTAPVPSVRVSTDGFATYKTLYGQEALDGAVAAGAAAASALTQSGAAVATANDANTAASSAQDAVQVLAQQIGTGTGGTTDYNALQNKPVIPPKSELTVDVIWNGTAYVVPAGYKKRVFTGPPTADPGVLSQDNDEWVKVTP